VSDSSSLGRRLGGLFKQVASNFRRELLVIGNLAASRLKFTPPGWVIRYYCISFDGRFVL
jgi:hypothetical protein